MKKEKNLDKKSVKNQNNPLAISKTGGAGIHCKYNPFVRIKNATTGITLVALVVTIVVLLILAGITIMYVMGDNGVFGKAKNAKDQTEIAKAREKLEMLFSSLQIEKYEQGLTEEDLDVRITEEINKIGGEETGTNKTEIIVDGHSFSVDRAVPKILDYIGPADGVVITASVSGNNGWLSSEEISNITVTGTIKTYSGGTITTVSATKGGTSIAGFSINSEGKYTINNIREDTTIEIYAKDSNNKENKKTISITIKIDNLAPTVAIDSKVENIPYGGKMKIVFTATATDDASGIKQLRYTISSTEDAELEGIPVDKRTGIIGDGKEVEITTIPQDKDEIKYIITVIAEDNSGKSGKRTAEVTTIYGLTISEVKELVISNEALQKYIGTRVFDYSPSKDTNGIYRVFYYDDDNYFGEGKGSIYLKRDSSKDLSVSLGEHVTSATQKGIDKMRQLNPIWRDGGYSEVDLKNEIAVSWLLDPDNWLDYMDGDKAKYVVGGPSFEMFLRAREILSYGEFGLDSSRLVASKDGYMTIGCEGLVGWFKPNFVAPNSDTYRRCFLDARGVNYYGWWICSPIKYSTSDFDRFYTVNEWESVPTCYAILVGAP